MAKTKENDWSVFLTDLGYDTNNPGDKAVFDAFKGKKSTPGDLVAVWVELGAKDVKDDLRKRGLDDDAQTRIFSGIRELVPKDKTDEKDILRRLEESNAQCIRLQTILDANKEDLKDILLQIDNALSQHGYYGSEVLALSDSTVVVKAERIADCYTVAIKLHRELSLASHEVDILAEVGGRSHCIKLLDSFAMQECDFSMALVFPYLQSGFWPNCESERRAYMHQILQAIQFCHSRGIIHRDVKPQNIFYSIDQHGHLQFVLGDFDLSHKLGQYELGGTLEYTAPEILYQHNYGFAVDVWAIGIIFAQLLLNVHKLFDVSTFVEMRELVKKSHVLCMLASSPTKISSSEEDLVVRLLTYNESFRITANEAIQHEYFSTIK